MMLFYNPGGFATARHMGRYESGQFTGSRNRYTTAEKLNILAVYNKLRSEGNFSLTQAAAVMHIDLLFFIGGLNALRNLIFFNFGVCCC
jgi:hypothetical protein